MKVFLGGTCNNSLWREKLIPMLKCDYFNPVVDDWTEECMKEEIKQRQECDYCLYTISPEMTGVYSIAEVVDDSNKKPNKTIFCVLSEAVSYGEVYPDRLPYEFPGAKVNFSIGEMKSLNQVGEMVKRNGGHYFRSLEEVVEFLNSKLITSDDVDVRLKNSKSDTVFKAFRLTGNNYKEYIKRLYIIGYNDTIKCIGGKDGGVIIDRYIPVPFTTPSVFLNFGWYVEVDPDFDNSNTYQYYSFEDFIDKFEIVKRNNKEE